MVKFNCRRAVATALLVMGVGGAHAAGVEGQGTWETSLLARDLNGDGMADAYYDTDLKITWLADANLAGSEGYASPHYGSISGLPGGYLTWDESNAFVAAINVGGMSGWRLPSLQDKGEPGCVSALAGSECGWNVDTSHAELAHLFQVTLGNVAVYGPDGTTPPNWGLTNAGPFRNIESAIGQYWYGVTSATNADEAWMFNMSTGAQIANGTKNSTVGYAWAVHAGDVGFAIATPVPEPDSAALSIAAFVLFGACIRGRKSDRGASDSQVG